jgi:hypothetical protein
MPERRERLSEQLVIRLDLIPVSSSPDKQQKDTAERRDSAVRVYVHESEAYDE